MIIDPNKPLAKDPRDRWRLFWHDQLGRAECSYISRWILDLGPLGSIRLHHWMHDDKHWYRDNAHAAHDHPWGFLTIMLWGSYTDVNHGPVHGHLMHAVEFRDTLRPGSIRWRPAEWTHSVETTGAWTLLWAQPKRRNFGFWVKTINGMRWLKANKFFLRYDLPPCS